MKTIKIGPITRANNTVAVEVTIDNKKVVDAKCSGIFFRGFEKILQGRDPRDASYLTQRICGICSSAHGTAASLALEAAAGVHPPRNGTILRNLIFGADLLQNHLRCFYINNLPDYVPGPGLGPFRPRFSKGYRLSERENNVLTEHYFQAVEMSRVAHDMTTLLGGKAPFPHGLLAGGSTVPPAADIIMTFRFKLKKIINFIKDKMIPDVYTLAEGYPECFENGVTRPNFLEFGLFSRPGAGEGTCFPAGVVLEGKPQNFDSSEVLEHLSNSWYAGEQPEHPVRGNTSPCRDKEGAYSWVKAPRYRGKPVEGGPLARLWISGNYRKGISTMDRHIARTMETEIVGNMMEEWLEGLVLDEPVFHPFEVPRDADGAGLTGAMRGPLGHWIRIEKGRIAHYQIITPSAWNFSPRDDAGIMGPVEEALIGTIIEDENEPIEVGRVIRSFDICSSCSTHVIVPGSPVRQMVIYP